MLARYFAHHFVRHGTVFIRQLSGMLYALPILGYVLVIVDFADMPYFSLWDLE